MKKTLLVLLSAMALTAFAFVQPARADDNKTEPWPGVTRKVLADNEHVCVFEVTFAPGAVATWHSHPQHTIYALTDAKLRIEEKGKETRIADFKAGDGVYSPAVTHQTSNAGDKAFTLVVTEIK